jgi:hypothetical protein
MEPIIPKPGSPPPQPIIPCETEPIVSTVGIESNVAPDAPEKEVDSAE